MSQRLIYLNPKQKEFLRCKQPFKEFLGGRGSGKTTTESFEQYNCMQQMPRSRGFLTSSTYGQLLTSTLPAVEAKWAEFGLEENMDYVVGKKPPSNFEKCLDEPRRYENVISFLNGRRIQMMSMDRPDTQRGGSYTDGAVDEAALVSHDHITRVLIPSLRGFIREFRTYLRGQLRLYTSIPWKPSGYWTLEYEDKARIDPKNYAFVEASAEDNIEVLGRDYLDRLRAELPYLEFLVEVMNQRIRKIPDAFYHSFNPEKHTYTGKYLYVDGPRGIETIGLTDDHYSPDEAIDLSFDFSGYFNCASAWQDKRYMDAGTRRTVEYCLRQFYVKSEDGKIVELVDNICKYYTGHKNKVVRLYGEPRGHDPRPDNPKTVFQQIADRFRYHGWMVEIRVRPGQVKPHRERCMYMNEVLEESNVRLPLIRINDLACKDIIIALQVTAVKDDYQKDKSSEKNRSFPQEQAPHFTDTVDYYIMQKYSSMAGQMRPALTAMVR